MRQLGGRVRRTGENCRAEAPAGEDVPGRLGANAQNGAVGLNRLLEAGIERPMGGEGVQPAGTIYAHSHRLVSRSLFLYSAFSIHAGLIFTPQPGPSGMLTLPSLTTSAGL